MGGIAWVALGGALGSVARFGMVRSTAVLFGAQQPWGTLLVNVLGSFIMGVVAALFVRKFSDAASASLFLMPGFLGGFTTFSAFSLDVFNLMQRGENGTAMIYVTVSVFLSIIAVFAGFVAIRVVT